MRRNRPTLDRARAIAAAKEAQKLASNKSAAVDDFVGMMEDEATVEAYNEGFDVVRITARDGNHFAVTRDYRTDRVNFNVQNHIVVAASIG